MDRTPERLNNKYARVIENANVIIGYQNVLVKRIFTVRVYPGATGRNIRGQSKIRNPQVLYVHLAKRIPDRLIKILPREHGRYWIGQVQQLPAPICHFLQHTNKPHLKITHST